MSLSLCPPVNDACLRIGPSRGHGARIVDGSRVDSSSADRRKHCATLCAFRERKNERTARISRGEKNKRGKKLVIIRPRVRNLLTAGFRADEWDLYTGDAISHGPAVTPTRFLGNAVRR